MRAVLTEAILLSQTLSEHMVPDHGLKVYALASIFHKDVEVLMVADTGHSGRNCRKGRES